MNVNLQAWFLQALKHERWKEPGWITQVFCVTELTKVEDLRSTIDVTPKPYDLFQSLDDKTITYFDPDDQEMKVIDNSSIVEPLIPFKKEITLKPGDIISIKEPTVTTYGTLIVNLYCCVYAFGDKLPYFNEVNQDGSAIQKAIIKNRVMDEENPLLHQITAREITQWKKSVAALEVFSSMCNASGSRASFTVSKRVLQLRDELFKKHEHELDDITVVADIEAQLIAEDRKHRAGDESNGFYGVSGKLDKVGRKKQKITYGFEGTLDGNTKLIKKSLSEGMDFEYIPSYADSITGASQSRGLLTAQGGELVKYNIRMFQNAKINIKDCGTQRFLKVKVGLFEHMLEGRFMQVNGKPVAITSDFINANKDKYIDLRTPGYCINSDRNFCECCTDVNLSTRPDGIPVAAAAGSNRIMQDSMKAMHGKVNENKDIEFDDFLS